MSTAPEQALFKGLKDLFAADTGSGLAGSSMCAPGGFVRTETVAQSAANTPRIECQIEAFSDIGLAREDASTFARCGRVSAILTAVCDRGTAHGTGDTPEAAGVIDNIVNRMWTVYENVRPTVSGWEPSKIDMTVVASPPSRDNLLRRSVRLSLTMEAA